ncbi:hypothetical protein FHR90_002064 [Endobacter medicaginis]|jgi:Glycosyl transferase family 2/F5/8 type C domain|uniref:Glycosyltransferase family 2 protein n=1 Tax=Endobacter medicaginis TaxID=1181271 RepID=A0A850NRQ6_9PROT|nr:glycosyltransferase family 2 protein [Endobacter medicaginis]MBB3174228.1 hypothetical protein [Endobacter medicaginis]MCX5474272.1 glycosyltransferase family 2 protein [Endobacter medicaginis]NVN30072.1 glycosyltransferase family 2 protein [Endobacter medicaginis]
MTDSGTWSEAHDPQTYLTQRHASPKGVRYGFVLIACARWEEAHICEWLDYHRSIGFDHVYLYSNDDSPVTLYERLLPYLQGPEPFVTYRHYAYSGQQLAIYRDALQRFSNEAGWVMMLDIDEFLCLPGVDNIGRFVADFESRTDAIYFNWKTFGTSGFARRPAGSVLLNYTATEGIVSPFTKVLIRSSAIPYAALHDKPHVAMMHDWAEAGPELRLCNVLGDSMTHYYRQWPVDAWAYLREGDTNERIRQRAYVAHFSMKSDEDFDRRVARGLKGEFLVESMWGKLTQAERQEFHDRTNAVTDTYLRDYWQSYLDQAYAYSSFEASPWPLVSEGCQATQSSIIAPHAERRSIEQDAASVLNEAPTGRPHNHTDREVDPWWRVDLGRVVELREVRLFNRLDTALERVANIRIEYALDDIEWQTLLVKTDGEIYGGLDGTPFRVLVEGPLAVRFVRVTVLGDTYLHFDRIEIFGTDVPDDRLATQDAGRSEHKVHVVS